MFLHALTLALLATSALAAQTPQQEPVELLLVNGRIVTLDEKRPVAEALASRNGRIVALGKDADLRKLAGEGTRVVDLQGALAIPGFIEGHAHFLGIGDARVQLDLMSVSSWEEIVRLVAAAAKRAAPGELIRGRGWHQEKWTRLPEGSISGLPTHASLSAVTPSNPVVLVHASGHASFANAMAMELAGVNASTPDPEGGELERDAQGNPTGMFRETAAGLLHKAYESARPTSVRRLAQLADQEVLAKGITSFQDAGSSFDSIDIFKDMAGKGELGVRLWVMIRSSNASLAERIADYDIQGHGNGHLTVRSIKRSMDGALGSHGAWLLEPYSDSKQSSGLNTASMESVNETARIAAEHGFQLCVHAIGDRANREVLDLFERTFAKNEQRTDWRWRVEHAQHLHADDVPRFARLGVIASMQGVHCTSDGPWVASRLGEDRAREGAYVWRKLLDAGAVVSNGTDAPVEDVDPLASYYSTVTRQSHDGSVFFEEQAMTRMEALRSYTESCAYAAFQEEDKGTLEIGKYADVTVLSKNILQIDAEEILNTKVLYTIVGGRVLYEKR